MDKYKLTINGNEYRFQEELVMDGYKFSLEKLSYDKGIYRPAEMSVTMNVGGNNVSYQTLVNDFHMKDVKLQINDNTVAENYFVFKVKPVFQTISNGSSVKLELTIYSQDKLMTLDKYSKAWSGRKLNEEIFSDSVKLFKFNKEVISTCSDLQILDYTSGEFIQPYLVQYNESFYDFLRRTANRCGEFLYHENGMLHLGMTVNDLTQTATDYAQIASERYYEDILREGTETSDYAYNYIDTHPEPKDKPYSNPLTYDDYLDDVSSEYTTMSAVMDYLGRNIVNSLCIALQGTSLSKIVSNLAVSYSFKSLQANAVTISLNSVNKQVNIDPWFGKDEQNIANAKVRQFGTITDQTPKSKFGNGTINMNASFYAMIREAEKKVSENAVYLEFGKNTQKLSIGDKITVDGVQYIVIGVNGGVELTNKLLSKYEERQQVIAVQLYGDVAIPPALPDIVIRESQPQLAFVTHNFDPRKIGRVRVRFAWQSKDDDPSPWIRVSLPFATDGAGVKFKPENDDEVMVSFEEGNIERPYVSGFLLSPRSNDSWSNLPDRTITSKNGHNITFNDGLDGGSFYWGFSPSWQLLRSFIPTASLPVILTDSTFHRAVTGGMTLSDRYGLYKIALSSDSRSVTIQSSMGNVTLNAFTGITLSAPNGDIKIHGKNVSIEASDTVTIESGQAVKNRFIADEDCYSEQGIKWYNRLGRSGADTLVDMVPGTMKRMVDNLIDLQLMRTVLDIMLRPIDGTTKIKSLTFVQIEAGKGSAEYPRTARKDNDGELAAFDLLQSIDKVAATAGRRVDAVHTAFEAVCASIMLFNGISGDNGVNPNGAVISFDDIMDASNQQNASELQFHWDQVKLDDIPKETDLTDQFNQDLDNAEKEKPKADDDKYKQNDAQFEKDMNLWEQKVKNLLSNYKTAIDDRTKKVSERKKLIEDVAKKLSKAINVFYKASQVDFKSDTVDANGLFFCDDIKTALKKMEFSKRIDLTQETTMDSVRDWGDLKKHHMRATVYLFLAETNASSKVNCKVLSLNKSSKSQEKLHLDDKWGSLVDDTVASSSLLQKAGLAAKDWFINTYVSPFVDPVVNRKRWAVGLEGKILLSDDSEKTITFDKNGVSHTTANVTFTDKTYEQIRRKLKAIGS